MSSSETAGTFAPVLGGEDLDPGGEDSYLATLRAARTVSQVVDALRLLGGLPYGDELERLGRREQALEAVKACPATVSAPAALVNQVFPLDLGRRNARDEPEAGGLGLEDVEPWTEPVASSALLNELASVFERYLALPPGGATTLALWTAYTYVFESFDTSPLLVVVSPEKRCGKTTAMTLLAHVCRRALPTSNITPAVLYRVVEEYHPTLFLDEADAVFGARASRDRREDLRGIINSGHTRSMAYVARCDGDNHRARLFSTWAPKVLALIGRLPDTLEDRSILLSMRRKLPGEPIERYRIGQLAVQLSPLRQKAQRWASDHASSLVELDPPMPRGLSDRDEDNWRPLLTIADSAGGEWPMKAREAVVQLAAAKVADDEGSHQVVLLEDIGEVFEQQGTENVFTETILYHLWDMEERPWSEWGRLQKPITPRGVARLLKPFGIRPRDVRIGSDHKKGYSRSDFEDAWSRYVPLPPSATPRQTLSDGGSGDFPSATEGGECRGCEEPETPEESGDVALSRTRAGGGTWELDV